MAVRDNIVKNQNNRVFYLEPNDIYEANNPALSEHGLVPYEDLCISLNLTCEVYDRRGELIKDGSFAMAIEADNVKNHNFLKGMGEHNKEFTLAGDDVSTYLTTYYTDVNSNDPTQRQLIEGLGVESINISYENYYAPRIQIKFVDVRGEALFGMEEKIHNEAGKITGENVFGAFFTIPYPKFRLQIKGFYGRPVTFQLACESFKGNFNATNGNFEVNVTFIGYQYSLMTDIPMRYLIAAPLQETYGADYWRKNRDSERWRLSDGSSPMTLFEFANRVKTANMDKENRKGGMSPQEEATLEQLNTFKMEYENLLGDYNYFVDMLMNSSKNGGSVNAIYNRGSINEQVLLMYAAGAEKKQVWNGGDFDFNFRRDAGNGVTVNFMDAVINAHNTLNKNLDDFNRGVRTGSIKQSISASDYVNGKREEWEVDQPMTIQKCIEKVTESDGHTKIHLCNSNYVSSGYFSGLELLDNSYKVNGVVLDKGIVSRLKDVLGKTENISKIGEYWLLIDLKELKSKIANGINFCKEQIDGILNSPSEKNEIDYTQVLGFVPSIGNIYKMTMCHLETLCHILFSIGNQIDSKHRTSETTGIGVGDTDTAVVNPKEEQTYGPFPGVLNKGTSSTENGDAEREGNYVRAWVGDIVNSRGEHPFEDEANLVRGFIRASQSVMEEIDRDPDYIISGRRELESIPVLPFDEMDGYNEFVPIENTNNDNSYISALAGQLGFRIANIFGISNGGRPVGGDSRLYGELDALNYYMSLKNNERLSKFIIGNDGENLSARLENIMLCNNSGQEYASVRPSGREDKRHAFETNMVSDEYSQDNRHPMFRKDGTSFEYCHYYDINGISLVPSYLASDFSYYSAPEAGSRMTRFGCKETKDGKKVTVYFEPCMEQVINSDYYDGYNFLYNTSDYPSVQDIEDDNYSETDYINTKMFDIVMADEDIADEKIDKYNRMLNETTVEAYDYTADISRYGGLYRRHWKLDRDAYNLLFRNKGAEMYSERLSGTMNPQYSIEYYITNMIKDTHCDVEEFSDKEAYRTKFIHELNVNEGSDRCESILAHNIYYLQNRNENVVERNRCKFLLMLHTLKYKKPNGNNWWFRNPNKQCGTIEMLPLGQVLLFGGLLWRQRQDNDPIVSEGEGIKYYMNKKDTLFDINGNFVISENEYGRYLSVEEYFGADIEKLDLRYQNRLVKFFLDFADNNFENGLGILEIRTNVGETMSAGKWKDIKDSVSKKHNIRVIKELQEKTDVFRNGNGSTQDNIDRYIGFVNNKGRVRLYISDDENHNVLQNNLRKLYSGEVFVYDCMGKYTERQNGKPDKGKPIRISESDYRGYLDGFADTLRKIHFEKTRTIPSQNTEKEQTLNSESFSKEMAIDIYYYLKNLWDKWLIVHHRENEVSDRGEGGHSYFNVENFFRKNFIFVDKFYINIFNLLLCNAEKVTDAITDIFSNRDASLYSFLSQICSDHGCMMFAMPDFINFGKNIQEGCDALVDAFTAYPYEKIGKPREENKFVVMYADHPSDTATDKTGYRTDCFDIKPTEDEQTLPVAFRSVKLRPDDADGEYDPDDNMKVMGYGVPAFGVSFGRQKQSLFKNINVNMNNPMTTSVSIQATTDIANMGKDTGRKVFFQGQDIFSIYSNYSYECEVEMMGNAQIMPLMYFQLMNIPLWRGAYMIFKVTHSITPGNMTTNFVGQKMSKFSTPWCTKSVVKAKDGIGIDGNIWDRTYRDTQSLASDYIPKETSYVPRVDESTFDNVIPCGEYKGYPENVNASGKGPTRDYLEALRKNLYMCGGSLALGNYALRCELAKMYLAVRNEYETACGKKYTVCITSAVRGKENSAYKESSEHNGPDSNRLYHSNAIDLNIGDYSTHTTNGKNYVEIFRLMDVILNNHFNDIGQLILEANPEFNNCFTDGTGGYKHSTRGYNCLHLSCGNKTSSSKFKGNKEHPEIFVSKSDHTSYKFPSVSIAAQNCAPEFLAIAGKFYWKIGYSAFHLCFNNFSNMTQKMLDELFSPYKDNAERSKSMFEITEDASKYGVDNSLAFREVVKYLGLPFSNTGGEVVRNGRNGYPMIDDSGRAVLADGSRGIDGKSLVTNVSMDINLRPCPTFSIESCRTAYAEEVSKDKLEAGDIIIIDGKDVVIYLGNGKVVGSDNNGVAIFPFIEREKSKYEYRRCTSIDNKDIDDNVALRLWNMLTKELHYTPEGAAGFLGNVYAESGMRTNNVIDTCPDSDETYTDKANGETMTKEMFMNDGYAYGLCQWTKTRKGKLWDYTRGKGKGVDNLEGQLELIKDEIKSPQYGNKLSKLTTVDSIYDATMRVMVNFEAPSYNECQKSFDRRYSQAKWYYNNIMPDKKTNDPQRLYYIQDGNRAKLVE